MLTYFILYLNHPIKNLIDYGRQTRFHEAFVRVGIAAITKVLLILLFILLLLVLLPGCENSMPGSSLDSTVIPTRISPEAGYGGITGEIKNAFSIWQGRVINVYAAEFHGDPDGKGVYILEPSLHPHARLEAHGFFQLNNVLPGAYVLVVGPNPDEALVIRKQDRPWVIRVLANQIIDMGSIILPQ